MVGQHYSGTFKLWIAPQLRSGYCHSTRGLKLRVGGLSNQIVVSFLGEAPPNEN